MKYLIAFFMAFFAVPAFATLTVGAPAPAFEAVDSNGVTHKLSDFEGKRVVLEWTNHQCPFVRKHYESNNIQSLQQEAAEKGIVWLSVISSAKGKQGHVSGDEANQLTKERGATPTAVLLDESGELGKLYDAKTTPHMYVIDEKGILVYEGAIDDNDSIRLSTVKTARNHVWEALQDLDEGVPVEVAQTQAYGCSVKY